MEYSSRVGIERIQLKAKEFLGKRLSVNRVEINFSGVGKKAGLAASTDFSFRREAIKPEGRRHPEVPRAGVLLFASRQPRRRTPQSFAADDLP